VRDRKEEETEKVRDGEGERQRAEETTTGRSNNGMRQTRRDGKSETVREIEI
jgi:hypothetical protein